VYVLWRVIVKEFLQLRQDKKMIPIIFVAPVIQIVLFGFAVNTDVNNVPTVLVDQDKSAASRDLVSRFVNSGYFELVGVEEQAGDVGRWLLTGRAQLALVIGNGYGRSLATGRSPQVQVIVDGSDSSATTVALGYASSIISGRAAETHLGTTV
jgi:ABC-2 type transport system permease protein